METSTIVQELLENMKRTPYNPDFSKLQAHLLGLTKTSIKESDAKFLTEAILEFVQVVIHTLANKGHREQTEISRKWLHPLQEFIIDNVRDVFVKRATQKIFDILLEEDLKGWCAKKELLKMFILCVSGTSKPVRSESAKDLHNIYLLKIIDSLSTSGDYDFQVTLVEMMFLIYGKKIVQSQVSDLIPESKELQESLVNIKGTTFDEDVRKFLNILNKNSGKVFSVVCKDVFLGSTKCCRTLGNIDGLWVDFNRSENVVSWYTINTNSETAGTDWNLILFFVSDVDLVQVKRLPSYPETIVHFKLTKPCISYMEGNEWVKHAGDVKLVLQNDSTESVDRLVQVLRQMFQNKLQQNGFTKVSTGQKAVYEPLRVSVRKRPRSDSNVTKSDASSFVTKLDPARVLSNMSSPLESPGSVYSISSASTKCAFVGISDSDDSSTILRHNSGQVPAPPQQSQYETARMCPSGVQPLKISGAQFSSNLIFPENLRESQERIQILSGRCSRGKGGLTGGFLTMLPKVSGNKPGDVRVSTNVAGCSSNSYETAREIPLDPPGPEMAEKGLFEDLVLEDVLEKEDGIDECPTTKQRDPSPVSTGKLSDCFEVGEERGNDSETGRGNTARTERRVLEELSLEPDGKQEGLKEESVPQQTENVRKRSSKYENERDGDKENIGGNIVRESEEVLVLHDVEEDEGQSDPKPPELADSDEHFSHESVVSVNRKSPLKRLMSSSDEESEELVYKRPTTKNLRFKKRRFVLPATKRNGNHAGTVSESGKEQKSAQDGKLTTECEKKEPPDGQCPVLPKQCVVLLPRHAGFQESTENSSDGSEGSAVGTKTKKKAKRLSPDTDSEDETIKSPEPIRPCVVLLPRHVGLEELDGSSSDGSERSRIAPKTEAKQLSPRAESDEDSIFEMVNVSLNRELYARQLSASTVDNQSPDRSARLRNCERAFDELKESLNSILEDTRTGYSQETQIHTCEAESNVIDGCAAKETIVETVEKNDIAGPDPDFVSANDLEPVRELETIPEEEEEVLPVFDQTMNTTARGRKSRKLYNPDDVSFLENMKTVEEDVPTRKQPENVLETTQQPRKVTRKKQIKHQKTEKSTRKLKAVNPDVTLDVSGMWNPPDSKSGFRKVLNELRRDTRTSFATITNPAEENADDKSGRAKTARRTVAGKRDKNNNGSKSEFASREPVRDLTIADISEISRGLTIDGKNLKNETTLDPLLLCCGGDLGSAVKPAKKINIISDIRIRPQRVLLEGKSDRGQKAEPVDNTNNDGGDEMPSFNTLQAGGSNSQIISERRIILKYMYRVFKHVLGKPDQSREYKDVFQICKLLKKYV